MIKWFNTKKVKWLLIALILIIMILTAIYLGNIKWRNIDVTGKRLFITYWKEYSIGGAIYLVGYIAIQELLDRL